MERYSLEMKVNARGRRSFSGVMVESEDGEWCRHDEVHRRAIEPALCAEEIAELILSATRPVAEEVGRLGRRMAELERKTGALEQEEFEKEMNRIEESFPDDL